MDREEVYRELEDRMGFVPEWIKTVPDESLKELSGLMNLRFRDTQIPPKYKDLIALAAATAMRSRTGIPLNRAVAKAHGATDGEINEAVLLASLVSLLGTYLDGIQYNSDEFKKEVERLAHNARERIPVGSRG